jgi:hypothetical protein
MSVHAPQMLDDRPEAAENAQDDVLALLAQGKKLAIEEPKFLIAVFAQLLRPYGIPPTPLHEVLHEAAKAAGWTVPSEKAQFRQKVAAGGRKIQREHDLAHRRVLVAYLFRRLRANLRAKPSSTGTVQAIIGRLDQLPFDRRPPMTVRTIQADIKFMKDNGNFGI